MYKVVETDEGITWNSRITPLVTLADEYGGRAQIVEDDHCLVLLLRQGADTGDTHYGYKPTYWWFKEAINALFTENLPVRYQPRTVSSKPRIVQSATFPNP